MRIRVLASVALLLALGCASNRHLYDGPQRPEVELARLDVPRYGGALKLLEVDGLKAPDGHVWLTPGEHELLVAGPVNIADEDDDELKSVQDEQRPLLTVTVELRAKRDYFLDVELRDPAFSRARSSEGRVWEETYYRRWLLELYHQPRGDPLPPMLLKSYPSREALRD